MQFLRVSRFFLKTSKYLSHTQRTAQSDSLMGGSLSQPASGHLEVDVFQIGRAFPFHAGTNLFFDPFLFYVAIDQVPRSVDVEHYATMEDGDAVTKAFGLFHVMRGEENRQASRPVMLQDFP